MLPMSTTHTDALLGTIFKSVDLGTGDGSRRDYVYMTKLGLIISKVIDGVSQNSQGQQAVVIHQPVTGMANQPETQVIPQKKVQTEKCFEMKW